MVYALTLLEAYQLEHLRNKGLSDQEIITALRNEQPSGNYHAIIELLSGNETIFQSVLKEGYTVKFVTKNGLQNLLLLKFDKLEVRDYQVIEKGVSDLQLNPFQHSTLKQLLSQNWKIKAINNDDDGMNTYQVISE